LIVAACICWGINNNLTRKLSAADRIQIAMVKGVAAGIIHTLLGSAYGAQLPSNYRTTSPSQCSTATAEPSCIDAAYATVQ
jgi:hypothetical protein